MVTHEDARGQAFAIVCSTLGLSDSQGRTCNHPLLYCGLLCVLSNPISSLLVLGLFAIQCLAGLLWLFCCAGFFDRSEFVSISLWKGRLWMRFSTFIAALLFFQTPAFGKSSIQSLEKRIKESKKEIAELKASVKTIVDLRLSLESDLQRQEEGFEAKFNRVVLPLLSWPILSLNSQKSSWSDRQEGRVLLDEVRERLVAEPLQLMADRELRLRTTVQLQNEYESKMKALEQRQKFLSLQLEEMKSLRAPSKSSKSKT